MKFIWFLPYLKAQILALQKIIILIKSVFEPVGFPQVPVIIIEGYPVYNIVIQGNNYGPYQDGDFKNF